MVKTYYDFINEISSDELYEGLLAYGFFSEKLPPVFTSVPFFDYCKNRDKFNSNWYEYVTFTVMRNINIPRIMGIPTPMKYANLCLLLRDNWKNIKDHFYRNTAGDEYRISRIHLRKHKNSKVVFEMNYKNWHTDGNPDVDLLLNDALTSKYLVKADISTCFPSIYSHALSWAFVGRDVAKKTCDDKSKWYNKIDSACQEMKNGETHGLLIGPHSSNLLSEIILTNVDKELRDIGYYYYRNIDDYDCYVNSYEDAQKFILHLEEALKEYDLCLNHKKTRILTLPIASTEHWIHKLNGVQIITEYGKATFKSVNTYLDVALKLCDESNNAAILNYAIKTLSRYKLTDNAKKVYVKRVMHLAVLNDSSNIVVGKNL